MSTAKEEGLLQTVRRVNSYLGEQLLRARKALRGEQQFEAQDVVDLQSTIEEMDAIAARSLELRTTEPDVTVELNRYASQLIELQTTIRQLGIALLAQRNSLVAVQLQSVAVSRWVNAAQQTR